MTLYLSILFSVFVIAFFYKNRSGISARFMGGILFSWITAIVFLIFYLGKQTYYWYEVNKLFHITPFIWNRFITRISINQFWLIRGINIGIVMFYYCCLCFAIAFTNKKSKNNTKQYLLLLLLPVLQILFFDPSVQRLLQTFITNREISFSYYNTLTHYIINFFKINNLLYSITMMAIMINHYIAHPKIKFLKTYTLFNIICVFPIVIMFCYTFKWYPQILIKITMKKDCFNYLVPNFKIDLLNNWIYYLVFVIAYIALAFYLYKYSSMENYYKKDNAIINVSINTANLGINTFTHSIKNHIQGIKSEANYLCKKYDDNEEIKDSMKVILQSCDICFSSIENANKQLKNIDLNLKLIPIQIPIKDALAAFNNTNLEYINTTTDTMAYIDEAAFKEVIVNIITNALDAIKDKSNGKVKISIKERGGWGIIEVEDNGCGIEEENLSKIFMPFFSTKCSVTNWGVGLAFCYKVINAHDGKFTVESKVGVGTKMSIAIPII